MMLYRKDSTCSGLEAANGLKPGDIRRFNPWINHDCSNISGAASFFGSYLCGGPQNGAYTLDGPGSVGDTTTPHPGSGHTSPLVEAPANAMVANGTTKQCGKWHAAQRGVAV